jgi:uncharacterized protein (TIGR00730 family)
MTEPRATPIPTAQTPESAAAGSTTPSAAPPVNRITVYCGSSTGVRPEYAAAARRLGTLLAERGLGLVYGGAQIGLMGIVADAVLAAGGEAIGVIPRQLVNAEVAHAGLTDLLVVEDMHERKMSMASLGDAFIALPGGPGTFEEIFEMWTWSQLGIHKKPLGFLNVAGFYDHLREFVLHATLEGFVRPAHTRAVAFDDDAVSLLERLLHAHVPAAKFETRPAEGAWIDTVAWVHVADNAVLHVRSVGRDVFYLPGGKREIGEHDRETLARELAEELGVMLRTETVRHLTTVVAPAHGHGDEAVVRMICYTGDVDGELVPSGEIAEMAWMTLADAPRCAPADRIVLARLADRGLLHAP